jgi:hypothetical protein
MRTITEQPECRWCGLPLTAVRGTSTLYSREVIGGLLFEDPVCTGRHSPDCSQSAGECKCPPGVHEIQAASA